VIYRTVRPSATASGTYMLVTLGRFSSVDPADQTAVDELDIRVLDHESGAAHSASMTGTACPTAGCSTGPPSKQWKRPGTPRSGASLPAKHAASVVAAGTEHAGSLSQGSRMSSKMPARLTVHASANAVLEAIHRGSTPPLRTTSQR